MLILILTIFCNIAQENHNLNSTSYPTLQFLYKQLIKNRTVIYILIILLVVGLRVVLQFCCLFPWAVLNQILLLFSESARDLQSNFNICVLFQQTLRNYRKTAFDLHLMTTEIPLLKLAEGPFPKFKEYVEQNSLKTESLDQQDQVLFGGSALFVT